MTTASPDHHRLGGGLAALAHPDEHHPLGSASTVGVEAAGRAERGLQVARRLGLLDERCVELAEIGVLAIEREGDEEFLRRRALGTGEESDLHGVRFTEFQPHAKRRISTGRSAGGPRSSTVPTTQTASPLRPKERRASS